MEGFLGCFQGMGEPSLPSSFYPNAPSGLSPRPEGLAFLERFPHLAGLPNLSSCFVGPFGVDRGVNPSTVRLSLPLSLNVHPAFHVSWVKLLSNRLLII